MAQGEAKPVRVRFPHTRSIWKCVVEEGNDVGVVDDERSDYFVMEYPSREVFEAEQARWQGMIEHEELTDEADHS